MNSIISVLKIIISICGGALGVLIGEINGMLIALLIFMILDYITGIFRAVYEKKLSSKLGFKGLVKKIAILCIVILGNTLDLWVLEQGAAVRGTIMAFYITNEGISILENTIAIGIPYPTSLKNIFSKNSYKDN